MARRQTRGAVDVAAIRAELAAEAGFPLAADTPAAVPAGPAAAEAGLAPVAIVGDGRRVPQGWPGSRGLAQCSDRESLSEA